MHNYEAALQTTPPKPTDQDICDRIYAAILARRLQPGARLVEEELARLFRYMLEPPLAAALARTTPDSAATMRPRMEAELAARAADDNAALVRLTVEFHLRLAELQGNALVLRALHKDEASTCLFILGYGRANTAACLPDEHERILAAIADGDEHASSALMLHHLHHVTAELDLVETEPRPLAAAFAPD